MTRIRTSLRRLADDRRSSFESAPDVRAWHVVLATEQIVGTVADLMIEPTKAQVVYLVVTIDPEKAGSSREVLAPVDCCRIDIPSRVVVLSGMSAAQIRTLPAADPEAPPADYDDRYRSRLSNAYPPKRATRPASDIRIRQRPD